MRKTRLEGYEILSEPAGRKRGVIYVLLHMGAVRGLRGGSDAIYFSPPVQHEKSKGASPYTPTAPRRETPATRPDKLIRVGGSSRRLLQEREGIAGAVDKPEASFAAYLRGAVRGQEPQKGFSSSLMTRPQ